jgi:hypothetical protein
MQNLVPQPWRHVAHIAVGGLRAIGFDRDSELLLVVSASGKSVVDCRAGVKIARDHDDDDDGAQFLETRGVGPLAGQTIRVAGLFGGGLPIRTADGWEIELVATRWPATKIVLVERQRGPQGRQPDVTHTIATESDLRACGFSYTGKSLVIATPADVAIYSRDA